MLSVKQNTWELDDARVLNAELLVDFLGGDSALVATDLPSFALIAAEKEVASRLRLENRGFFIFANDDDEMLLLSVGLRGCLVLVPIPCEGALRYWHGRLILRRVATSGRDDGVNKINPPSPEGMQTSSRCWLVLDVTVGDFIFFAQE